MAKVLKKTTGLTGLAVSEQPHRELAKVYKKIMTVLVTIPAQSAYRKHTEKLIKERSAIVNENSDVATIEKKIGCGQVEEIIQQAKNELNLAEKMVNWKPWESLIEEPPKHQWTWPPYK
ncbi:NADH dehydrogenase [ubiquinone] 1 alpha subcomplex subunit 5 [Hylaeus volcanicus]|uniref:NADH dehydrogenase [ubiquinone] 1 alpha subcomplex subunit 5 n=1 Tax=Hylaeus volcanicus TaxID=313075 RepID=UPI0023B7D5DC|nr:NADH dehydrogenase [ubiquinone] 1 alpha subcomplex subunit 5 [Hylaeus volcanicus]